MTGPEAAAAVEALDLDNGAAYVRERGLVPDGAAVEVDALSGGISNIVLRARWAGGCVVVKQSLPRLRVEADWAFDRRRVLVERDCMETLAEVLPGRAPEVVFSDEPRYAFGMTCAPDGGVVWKDALLAGAIDPARTEAAAELLGTLQRRTAGDARIAARFDDQMVLMQGRVDPYHRTAALAHPDLAGRVGAEVERMLATRSVLVHGDYSPKNLIAYPDGMLMLDFEVAHWGDPAFDPAFLLTHLVLKAVRDPALAGAFLDEAERFWRVYREAAGADIAADERAVVAELGRLLLARIDGKSPIEYLTGPGERSAVRALARALLADEAPTTVEGALLRARRTSHPKGPT